MLGGPVPDLLSIGPDINTEWSEYPTAVQVCIYMMYEPTARKYCYEQSTTNSSQDHSSQDDSSLNVFMFNNELPI